MDIAIKIIDTRTQEMLVDNVLTINDYDFYVAQANHESMRKAFPDCCVNFTMNNGDFIFGMPLNQEIDERAYDQGLITWEEYCNRWFKGALSGCNEDSDLDIIDRYEEEDFASRDSICY